MDRLTGGPDGVRDVLQAVAGHDGDDRRVVGDQPLLAGLLQRRRARDARGFAEYAAGAAEQALRGENLLVGDVDGDAV